MTITAALLVALSAQAPVQAVDQVDVAYDELSAGQNEAAIREIEANAELERDDPSRLINLGVAHARKGDVESARAMFRAALFSEKRQVVETSSGEWIDSRVLARTAMARLDRGELEQATMFAAAD